MDPQAAELMNRAAVKRSKLLITFAKTITFMMSKRPQTQTLLKAYAYQASSGVPDVSAHDTL
eukprot:15461126-Alexandrium_andersonii.AAC.1